MSDDIAQLSCMLDIFFYWLHILIIVFNLTGWIWSHTRKLHLLLVFITAFSWLILGLEHGLGYCFLTDWHWQIKYAAGHADLPNSFITYIFNYQLGFNFPTVLIDIVTGVTFLLIVVLSLYTNRKWLSSIRFKTKR